MIRYGVCLATLLLIACLVGLYCLDEKKSLKEIFFDGLMMLFCIFEIESIFCIFIKFRFSTLCYIYVASIVLMCLWIFFTKRKAVKIFVKKIRTMGNGFKWKNCLIYLPVILVIGFQMYMAGAHMHIDDDDAFYVATAATSMQTDTLFQYNAYTGAEMDTLPARYVLSPWPIFVAFLAKISGVSAAVMSHTLLPPVMILLAYIVYALFAQWLWKEKHGLQACFLFFVAWINMMGYYSVYPASVFLLIRIWQGKAVLAAIVLPFLLYKIFRNTEETTRDFGVAGSVGGAALCSSMGIFLAPMAIGIMSIVYIIRKKSRSNILYWLLCCLPCFVLGIIYLYLSSGVL